MNFKFSLQTLCCITLFSLHVQAIDSQAEVIYIHTENQQDFEYLNNNNGMHRLSVATNLYALSAISQPLKFEYMTAKRSLKFMDQNNESICLVNKLKTQDRLEKYIFSSPINLFLGRRLYQDNFYSVLNGFETFDNQISLDELFKQKPDARILISNQISYGDELEKQLAALSHKNKVIRHSPEHDSGIISMFSRGHIEFSLLYPQQVYNSKTALNVRSYKLANTPPFVLGHLMCNKTPETKSFVKQINTHLNKQESSVKLLDIHLQFINQQDQAMLTHYFHQVFYYP